MDVATPLAARGFHPTGPTRRGATSRVVGGRVGGVRHGVRTDRPNTISTSTGQCIPPGRTTSLAANQVDIDATIVTACSEKEQAAPTWKKTFGFHPLGVFADHGHGTSEHVPDGTDPVQHLQLQHRASLDRWIPELDL